MTKVWLITGGSRGFGRELARAALEGGDRVLATARRPEQLQGLAEEHADRVRTAALDVTDAAACRAAVQRAVEQFGGLDVVVNNAGYANSSPIEDTPDDDFRAQVETNLFGAINVTKAALPVLHAQRSGHFIQFSSIGGRVGGTPGLGAYQTAKWGLEGFSEVLVHEVGPLGIKVTIIEPGGFRTDWGGSSMQAPPVGDDYDRTVGAMNRYRESTVSTWAGDPARAAKIITELVRLDEPPLRLLLGAGAVDSAEAASVARAAEADQWAAVSRSADFGADAVPVRASAPTVSVGESVASGPTR
jgi:NAD(P)-dependent dehydrogenase (short-subunit alcohol dehydrogenase family)